MSGGATTVRAMPADPGGGSPRTESIDDRRCFSSERQHREAAEDHYHVRSLNPGEAAYGRKVSPSLSYTFETVFADEHDRVARQFREDLVRSERVQCGEARDGTFGDL